MQAVPRKVTLSRPGGIGRIRKSKQNESAGGPDGVIKLTSPGAQGGGGSLGWRATGRLTHQPEEGPTPDDQTPPDSYKLGVGARKEGSLLLSG